MDSLYSSKYYSFYQNRKNRRFLIDLGHKEIEVSFCQLLSLRYKLKQLTTHEKLVEMIHHQDTVLLSFCDKQHILLLDMLQLLDLKDLIQGSFAMIELQNTLVNI